MATRIIDLIDASGIAEHFGIARSTVSNWQARYDDFPAPIDLPLCRGNKVWDISDVMAWMDLHTKTVTTRVIKEASDG
jgi:predicted DNA-binding transcriptional regulator AlpA